MMKEENAQLRLDSLERRTKQLQKWLTLTLGGWLLTISVLMLSWTFPSQPRQAGQQKADSLRVNKLVIVDENGKERIVIAAPIPDPIVDGKVRPWRDVVTAGIQFKDPNGTERGGIAALADGSFAVGIDDERGKERAHLYYIPNRGSGVFLQGETGKETVSLLLHAKGESPNLEMTNKLGKK